MLSNRRIVYAYAQDRFQDSGYELPFLLDKPEDHWSCIAHLSAEDMLKSAVFEEKKLKHGPYAVAGNSLGQNFLCQQEGLITMVICCKFIP